MDYQQRIQEVQAKSRFGDAWPDPKSSTAGEADMNQNIDCPITHNHYYGSTSSEQPSAPAGGQEVRAETATPQPAGVPPVTPTLAGKLSTAAKVAIAAASLLGTGGIGMGAWSLLKAVPTAPAATTVIQQVPAAQAGEQLGYKIKVEDHRP